MKRYSKFLIWMVLISALLPDGLAELNFYDGFQDEYPDVFWDNLTYRGVSMKEDAQLAEFIERKKTEVKLSSMYAYEIAYAAYYSEHVDECDTMVWNGIEFRFESSPPQWWGGFEERLLGWRRYFNEMYYDGQREVFNDAGFSPFWEGARRLGKAVDPFKIPSNYEGAYDYYADRRSELGYGWYWSYYFDADGSTVPWTWYGAGFDVNTEPPGMKSGVDTDPFYFNRHFRSFLDLWEDYFDDLYEQSVPFPDESVGQCYAWVDIKSSNSHLNVRKKATSQSKALAKLSDGERVIVVSKVDTRGWVRVIYDLGLSATCNENGDYTLSVDLHFGYVKAKYLKFAS